MSLISIILSNLMMASTFYTMSIIVTTIVINVNELISEVTDFNT